MNHHLFEEYNEGHQVEALETLMILQTIISQHLKNHPAICKANQQDQLSSAADSLANIYQKVGAIE